MATQSMKRISNRLRCIGLDGVAGVPLVGLKSRDHAGR